MKLMRSAAIACLVLLASTACAEDETWLTDFAKAKTLAAEPIGQVIALQGKAVATGADGTGRALALKTPIFLNDKVATKVKTKIQIMFNDDSIISQGENSEMTIDEFIYSPDKKEKNGFSARLVKGMFRMITGKIAEMNPDRFKVRTRMATIGIRGCDLGFKVTEIAEDIYVIALHGEESITVRARPNVGDGEWKDLVDEKRKDGEADKTHLINVLKPNRVISMNLQKTRDELRLRENMKGASTEGRTQPTITQGEGVQERELTPNEVARLILAVTPETPAGKKQEGTPTSPSLPPPPTESVPSSGDNTSSPVEGIKGSGRDWGFWVDGRVEFTGNGLSDLAFRSIADGAQLYDLTGSGSAGAAIEHC